MKWGKKSIAVKAVLILGLCSPMAVLTWVDRPAAVTYISESQNFSVEKTRSMVLAQNDKTTSDENEKPATASENAGPETEAETGSESSTAESKELRPFVPSEKIPGEQAVDFPVDI